MQLIVDGYAYTCQGGYVVFAPRSGRPLVSHGGDGHPSLCTHGADRRIAGCGICGTRPAR